MKTTLLLVLGTTVMVLSSVGYAAPELTGNPGELRQYLRAETRSVTLRETAMEKAYTDQAVITLTVSTENKLLVEALAENRSIRQSAVSTLTGAGVSAEDIRSSDFSTSPNYGWFGSKTSSFSVDNKMVVRVANENQFQVVAGIADQYREVKVSDTKFEHSLEEEYKDRVRKSALDKVKKSKEFYEQELGLRLRPVSFSSGRGSSQGQADYGVTEEVVVTGSRISNALVAQQYKLPVGFDEIEYNANISVTYEVVPPAE